MVFSHPGKKKYRCTHANTLLSHPSQSGLLLHRLQMASLASRETTALTVTPLGTWAHLPLPRIVFRSQSKHTYQTQIPLPREAFPGTHPHPSPKQYQVLVLSSTQPWPSGDDCIGASLWPQVVYIPVLFLSLSNCFGGKGQVFYSFFWNMVDT